MKKPPWKHFSQKNHSMFYSNWHGLLISYNVKYLECLFQREKKRAFIGRSNTLGKGIGLNVISTAHANICFRSKSKSFSRNHNFLLVLNSNRWQCHTQWFSYAGQLISMAELILYLFSPILNVSAVTEVRKSMLRSWVALLKQNHS